MKLQPELLRDILIWCEDNLDGKNSIKSTNIQIDGYSPDEIGYHVSLLFEAGYITGIDTSAGTDIAYLLRRLTLDGHQLLVTMRSDTTWNHVKEYLGKMGLVAIPELIKYLVPFITSQLGGF